MFFSFIIYCVRKAIRMTYFSVFSNNILLDRAGNWVLNLQAEYLVRLDHSTIFFGFGGTKSIQRVRAEADRNSTYLLL